MSRDNDDLKTNGRKKLPDSLRFERSEVKCQRCKRTFEHFILEEIDDLAQLRCGDVLIPHTELVCLHCGWTFYWNLREKDMEKMAIRYGQLIVAIRTDYNPE